MDNAIKSAYECMFVSDVANGVEAAQATEEKFVGIIKNNGEVIDITTWGKRTLAYPINDKNEGYYTIATFRAEPDFPNELERLLNIDENVMRSLILKLDEEEAEKVARRAADKAAEAEKAAAAAEEAPAEEAPAEEAAAAEEAPAEEAAPAADAE